MEFTRDQCDINKELRMHVCDIIYRHFRAFHSHPDAHNNQQHIKCNFWSHLVLALSSASTWLKLTWSWYSNELAAVFEMFYEFLNENGSEKISMLKSTGNETDISTKMILKRLEFHSISLKGIGCNRIESTASYFKSIFTQFRENSIEKMKKNVSTNKLTRMSGIKMTLNSIIIRWWTNTMSKFNFRERISIWK